MDNPKKGDPMIPHMDVYKAKIQSYGSINNLISRIVVRAYF